MATSKPSLSPALAALSKSVLQATLPNGLKVRLLPSAAVPTISYYTFFKVGSRNERPGITGISHLFEHMMFNGAKKYGPGEFDKVLESAGGSSNAYTSNDLTVYHEDFMAEALPTVIDLESDRMRSLAVAPKLLESERQVVLEERRLRVDNDQLGLMDEELGALMFKAHAYRWPVIGWQRDIEAITREDCLQYFRTFYAPNNAILYVAGDFEPKDTLQRIKKAYGAIKPGPAALPVLDAEPTQRGERRAEVLYPAQAPALMVSWRAPKSTERDTLVLDVLQFILSAGQSSRLTKSLVFEQEVAVSCGVDFSWRLDPAAFTITLELKPGGDVHAAQAALTAQLEAVISQGVTAREVEKATNNLAASLLRELATNSGRAHSLGSWEAMLGDWRTGLNLAEAYRTVTPEQVQRAAAQYLKPGLRNVVTLVPSQSAEVAA